MLDLNDTIKVPLVIPRNWAPAWSEKPLGIEVRRTLSAADMLAATGRELVDAQVEADPLLAVPEWDFDNASVWLTVPGGDPAGIKRAVRFVLTFSDRDQLEVIAYQPTRLAPLSSLAPVQGIANTLVDPDGFYLTDEAGNFLVAG